MLGNLQDFKKNVLAIIAGVLLTLAFSPFNYWPLVFISLAIFKLLLVGLTKKQAFFKGFLFGLGLFGSGVSWVFVSMTLDAQNGIVIPLFMTLLYCSFWAIFPALFAYLFVLLQCKQYFLNSLLFACLWILVEYIRGEWIFNGFPWLQVAYTQLDSPLSAYIPIVGVYGAGFVILLCTVLLVDSFLIRKGRYYCISAVMIIFLLGWLLQGVNWTQISGESFKAVLIQGNIAQKDKWLINNRELTLQQYYDDTIKHWDADIIIWPETAIPAFYDEVKDKYLIPLEQQAIETHTEIIISLPYLDDKTEELFNTVRVLGKQQGMYKKIHLLPFGEYLPEIPLLTSLLDKLHIRLGLFTAGDKNQKLLYAAGHHFITSICYEDAFGQQSIAQVEQARFLVNVTNDAWFGHSLEPYQHMQIARMRALESGRYLLRATNTGITAVVSDKGIIIQQADLMTHTIISADIPPMKGLTPYAKLGDKPIIMLILLILGVLISLKYKDEKIL